MDAKDAPESMRIVMKQKSDLDILRDMKKRYSMFDSAECRIHAILSKAVAEIEFYNLVTFGNAEGEKYDSNKKGKNEETNESTD